MANRVLQQAQRIYVLISEGVQAPVTGRANITRLLSTTFRFILNNVRFTQHIKASETR